MNRPAPERVFEVLDATWPAKRSVSVGPWRLRHGNGGGQRVSAATAETAVKAEDIDTAAQYMRTMGQHPLFMVRDGDEELDIHLEDRGYQLVDSTVFYIAATADLTAELALTAAMPTWPPLAVQREIWANGGIGPARIAVMERCALPKITILGRSGDVPAGTSYVASHNDIAMVHAVEVDPSLRRRGVGRLLMQACANWAAGEKATWLSLAVTRANKVANALYVGLGMTEVTSYHYRRAPETAG